MRRILIYIHSFEPFSDSNTNALIPLLPLLTEDFDVDIFCANINNKARWRDSSQGCTVFRYASRRKFEKKLLAYSFKEVLRLRPGRPRVVLRGYLRNARIRAARMLTRVLPHCEPLRLKKLIESRNYAALVTVTSPIRPQLLALRLMQEGVFGRTRTAWIPWFMDPYSTYIGHSSDREAMVLKERAIYEAASLVIVTPELDSDNTDNEFAKYRHKTRILPLANLRVQGQSEGHIARESDEVHFLYAGSLQDVAVRNPTSLFRLISRSPHNFIFHLMITTWCHEAEVLRDEYLSECSHVRWRTPMPLGEALAFNREMDVLINIGNEANNQLPGKCYDLVGTGQPILNVFTRDDDTSERFLGRYPLHLGLQLKSPVLDDELIDEQIKKLTAFVLASHGRRVPAELTTRLYEDYLPERIYVKFKSILEEAMAMSTRRGSSGI